MRCRVYTDSWEKAYRLSNYLWYHPALYDFIDWDCVDRTTRRKNPRINLPGRLFLLPLTNGTIFVLGPESQRNDLGVRYDTYAEYTSDCCPIDILLLVIGEVVK